MIFSSVRPVGYWPDNFMPDGYTPTGTAPAGYLVISQPTADVGAAKTQLAHLPPGTSQYLLTGAAGTVRWVFIRAVSACAVGDGEPVRTKLRRIAFDLLGALVLDAPNAPHGLHLTVGAGGLVTAHWAYSRAGEAVAPDSFNIYTATGVAAFDFNTPAGNVKPSRGNSFSATFAHGTLARFVVRAVSAAGGEEPNTLEAQATADAQAPAAPTGVVVEVIT